MEATETRPLIIFRIEVDKATLRLVADEARQIIKQHEQWAWGNALEKADEELRVEPFVDVHVDEQGTILGLIYPPHERIGVTYYVQVDRCQCEAWTEPKNPDDPNSPPQKKPCRHRAKLRLIERAHERGGVHPVRTVQGG